MPPSDPNLRIHAHTHARTHVRIRAAKDSLKNDDRALLFAAILNLVFRDQGHR